jgi:hypothetical protein
MDAETREIMLRKLAAIIFPKGGDSIEGYDELIQLAVDMDKRLKALELQVQHLNRIHPEHRGIE